MAEVIKVSYRDKNIMARAQMEHGQSTDGDGCNEQSDGKQERKTCTRSAFKRIVSRCMVRTNKWWKVRALGGEMDRSTLENKLLHVPLITTTLREKWPAAEESDQPRHSQVWQYLERW
jgi:hypothetical protein